MASPLISYLRRLRTQELLLKVPVLVWMAADVPAADRLDVTMAATRVTRPKSGDPIVFELQKRITRGDNPLTMGITVGRTEANDLSVDDASVSRFHAFFKEQQGQWFLVDAESKNGSWVGPLKLQPKEPAAIADGMVLRFGDVRVKFMMPATFLKYMKERQK